MSIDQTMSREVELKFPLGGYDANWAYGNQPEATTPSCLNVRGYSTDAERARGGSRPGLKRAYTQQLGGGSTPVQWLGWLDYGFGDVFPYRDDFEYENGTLSDQDDWAGTDSEVKVRNGYVHLEGTLPLDDKAATFDAFAGDTWNDFALEAAVQWGYGTTGSISLWVSDTTDSASAGAKVTVSFTSTEIASPGLGFQGTFQVTLASGGEAQYTRAFGAFFAESGGSLRVEADKNTVRALWRGREIISVPRADGTCDKAGFKMSVSNPVTGDWFPDSMVDFRLLSWELTAFTRPTAVSRKLIAVAGRRVWAESAEGTMGASPEDTDQLADVALVSAAHCNGSLFLVDGGQPRYYDPLAASDKVKNWTARKGELIKTCRGIVNWRNRLVLFGSIDDPQNYHMSRQGNPWDFDTGIGDARSATAGSLSDAGRIGDPITALCPVSDEMLVIGCTRSIWVMHGDPMQGGYATRHCDQTGILASNAWTTDPQDNLYFLGEEGLYVMAPGGRPKNLTSIRIPGLSGYRAVQPGQAGSAGQHYVTLAYDADRHGVLIFLAPYAAAAAVHYFYDLRNDALWPESYHNDIGPACAAYYNAAAPACRKLLLGGRNGYLYEFNDATKSDVVDGSTTAAISSHVWLGPRRLGDSNLRDAVVTNIVGVLSGGSDEVTRGIYSGDTVEAALGAGPAATGTWGAGKNTPDRTRIRGGAHGVKISNATAGRRWAVENVTCQVVEGGPQR